MRPAAAPSVTRRGGGHGAGLRLDIEPPKPTTHPSAHVRFPFPRLPRRSGVCVRRSHLKRRLLFRATRGALAGSVRCLSGNERRSRPSGRLRHVDQHHSRFGWAFEWSGSLRARCWTSSIPPAGMAINFARSRRQCTASIPSARHGECQTCGHGGELVRPSELGVARGGWRATVSPRVWRETIAAAGCLSACSGRGCTRR